MSRRFAALAALLLVAQPASPVAAQAPAPPPARPPLAAAADTNDWEAYYDRGVELLRMRKQIDAERYFYWASRLDPSRAEPLFARWVTFWARDPQRYVRYLDGERDVVDAKDVRANDTLRTLAEGRNPLHFQGLEVMIMDQLPGRWRDDPVTRGWLAYGQLQFDRAREIFRVALQRDPKKHAWIRYSRALVFTAQERYDSAAAEMQQLVTDLRARDTGRIASVYFSKAFPEYTIGRLLASRGDPAGATAALERALSEDLAFAPAHEWMGQLALGRGDTDLAIRELQQAVELRPGDAVLRWAHGRALGAAGRDAEAVEELRRAIALEPWYADPYFSLALALDRQGDREQALAGYRDYLARATRSAPNAARAQSRLAQLEGAAR